MRIRLRHINLKARIVREDHIVRTVASKDVYKRQNLASQAGDEKLSNNLLYTQAGYYYTFGQNEQGDAAFQKLINQYKEKDVYKRQLINRGPSGVSHCFTMYLAKSRYLSCRVRLYRYITGSSTEELGIPI